MTTAEPMAEALAPVTKSDYLGLTVEQRYSVVSQRFPPWLLTEPIEFPPHHETYGWACRVEGCDGGLGSTETRLICSPHAHEYCRLQDTAGLDEFVRTAEPVTSSKLGWALSRRPDCAICGSNREAWRHGYCTHHGALLGKARRRTAWPLRCRMVPAAIRLTPATQHERTGTCPATPRRTLPTTLNLREIRGRRQSISWVRAACCEGAMAMRARQVDCSQAG